MAPGISVVARRTFTHEGLEVPRGWVFTVSPVQAAILIRRQDVRFATPGEANPPPTPRRYRRRDLRAEA